MSRLEITVAYEAHEHNQLLFDAVSAGHIAFTQFLLGKWPVITELTEAKWVQQENILSQKQWLYQYQVKLQKVVTDFIQTHAEIVPHGDVVWQFILQLLGEKEQFFETTIKPHITMPSAGIYQHHDGSQLEVTYRSDIEEYYKAQLAALFNDLHVLLMDIKEGKTAFKALETYSAQLSETITHLGATLAEQHLACIKQALALCKHEYREQFAAHLETVFAGALPDRLRTTPLATVQALIRPVHQLESSDADGNTLAHKAAEQGCYVLFRWLIEQEPNLATRTNVFSTLPIHTQHAVTQDTLLHVVARQDKAFEQIDWLLAQQADVSIRNSRQVRPLDERDGNNKLLLQRVREAGDLVRFTRYLELNADPMADENQLKDLIFMPELPKADSSIRAFSNILLLHLTNHTIEELWQGQFSEIERSICEHYQCEGSSEIAVALKNIKEHLLDYIKDNMIARVSSGWTQQKPFLLPEAYHQRFLSRWNDCNVLLLRLRQRLADGDLTELVKVMREFCAHSNQENQRGPLGKSKLYDTLKVLVDNLVDAVRRLEYKRHQKDSDKHKRQQAEEAKVIQEQIQASMSVVEQRQNLRNQQVDARFAEQQAQLAEVKATQEEQGRQIAEVKAGVDAILALLQEQQRNRYGLFGGSQGNAGGNEKDQRERPGASP